MVVTTSCVIRIACTVKVVALKGLATCPKTCPFPVSMESPQGRLGSMKYEV